MRAVLPYLCESRIECGGALPQILRSILWPQVGQSIQLCVLSQLRIFSVPWSQCWQRTKMKMRSETVKTIGYPSFGGALGSLT